MEQIRQSDYDSNTYLPCVPRACASSALRRSLAKPSRTTPPLLARMIKGGGGGYDR